jgi:hypothetical protein
VIPVVFGTVLLRGANVTWYGDLYAKPIKKDRLVAVARRRPGGRLANALSPTYAYRYFWAFTWCSAMAPWTTW